MAQGNLRMGAAKKSKGSQKRKTMNAKKKVPKGRKNHVPKGYKGYLAKQQAETTKAINRKNEALTSAKAMGGGNTFFLSDIKDQGAKELAEQESARGKKEDKKTKLEDRLKDQLRKLGKDA